MKKNEWLLIIYLCFFIPLISCNNSKSSGIPEFRDDVADITFGEKSDKLIARIYFDATLSMQGFVKPGSTHYTRMCFSLESVIVSGWTDETVDFFWFGEQVEPIDRSTYLRVGSVEFYEQEHIYRETLIEKIIDYESQLADNKTAIGNIPEEPVTNTHNTLEDSPEVVVRSEEINEKQTENTLVVIVTDLFQDKSDINLLVTHLKEKYIKEGFEIGLFGLRSQYDGMVFDTGINLEPLRHRSNPVEPETFRPFYLLVLGRHADIVHYFESLAENGFSEANTVIFSRYLVNPLLSFEGASIEKDNLNRKIINSDHSQNPRLKQYVIWKESNPAKIRATLEYTPLPYAMVFDSDTIMSSVSAQHALMGETKPSVLSTLKLWV